MNGLGVGISQVFDKVSGVTVRRDVVLWVSKSMGDGGEGDLVSS